MLTPLALLIGFAYHDLNGTLIDLYHSYKWCQNFNCRIHVITDIKEIKEPRHFEKAIKQGLVDHDINTFYDTIIQKYIVSNKYDFISGLQTVLKTSIDSKLIIYYTGHALKQGIELPDHSIMSFNEFRDHILQWVDPQVEIFWILDCCNPNGLSLPYQLKNNQFIFKNEDSYYGLHRILLITSSNPNEKSVATKTGSLFTRYLFQILSKMTVTTFDIQKPLPLVHNRNLQRLIGNLSSAIRTVHSGYSQTVSIYTSYLQDPVLWMWIGSTKPYDIISTDSTIIIRRKT
jgi:hypothetical protein